MTVKVFSRRDYACLAQEINDFINRTEASSFEFHYSTSQVNTGETLYSCLIIVKV